MEISSRSFSDTIKQEQSGTSDGEEVYICWNDDNSGHEDETNSVLWSLVIECFAWYLKAALISIAIFLQTGWKKRIIDEEVGSCILWTICVAKVSAFLRSWRISRIYIWMTPMRKTNLFGHQKFKNLIHVCEFFQRICLSILLEKVLPWVIWSISK